MNKRQSRNMSAKKYNSSYGKRGTNYLTYCKAYYLDEDTIVTEHRLTLFARILFLLLTPLIYILNFMVYGISGLKDSNTFVLDNIRGVVISEDVTYRRQGEHWDKIANFIETGELKPT